MKRLHTVACLILTLAVLVMPAVARTGDDTSATPAATTDGWTWDEL